MAEVSDRARLDVLLGSHTERVIRQASCPVLSVPM
jgi:nucleotide-binding universal stress UspA family protein